MIARAHTRYDTPAHYIVLYNVTVRTVTVREQTEAVSRPANHLEPFRRPCVFTAAHRRQEDNRMLHLSWTCQNSAQTSFLWPVCVLLSLMILPRKNKRFISELSLCLERFCRSGGRAAVHTERHFFDTDNEERWAWGLKGSSPHLAGMLESLHASEWVRRSIRKRRRERGSMQGGGGDVKWWGREKWGRFILAVNYTYADERYTSCGGLKHSHKLTRRIGSRGSPAPRDAASATDSTSGRVSNCTLLYYSRALLRTHANGFPITASV